MGFPYTDGQFFRKIARAAAFYWETRRQQAVSQMERGVKDAGTRGQETDIAKVDSYVESLLAKVADRQPKRPVVQEFAFPA